MGKVIGLLEKLGLVTTAGTEDVAGDGPTSPPDPSSSGSAASGASGAPPAAPVELDVAALERQPAGEEYALEQVYASAGIQPPAHGFTVYRLIEMLEAEEFRGMDAATRARVIAGMLRRLPTGAVEVGDIVRDAAARDRALDAFERFLADRVTRQLQDADEKNRVLQAQIEELTKANTALMEENRAAVEAERARLERWLVRKRAEEDRLFDAVQPFVEHNPISRQAPGAPTAKP
jgi:hypothetical protein